MPDPSIRVILDAGDDGRTWVTQMPVRGWDANAVYDAVQEASRAFQHSIFREEKEVQRRLRDCIGRG